MHKIIDEFIKSNMQLKKENHIIKIKRKIEKT